MTESEFLQEMSAAETFRPISDTPDFWSGYMRGLRRNFHGERFGTEAQHSLWMRAAESGDRSHRMRGKGYRAGFAGDSVQSAMAAAGGKPDH